MVAAALPALAAKTTPSTPSILALDLGSTTGWAIRNSRCRILHGTAEFRSTRFEGGGMRYLRFGKWLDQTLEVTGGIDAVYVEEVRRHVGTDAAHVYGGLLATLTSWCEAHGIPYQGVPVGTWKRHACGKGNADKQAVIAAMRARGPAPPHEADEAKSGERRPEAHKGCGGGHDLAGQPRIGSGELRQLIDQRCHQDDEIGEDRNDDLAAGDRHARGRDFEADAANPDRHGGGREVQGGGANNDLTEAVLDGGGVRDKAQRQSGDIRHDVQIASDAALDRRLDRWMRD